MAAYLVVDTLLDDVARYETYKLLAKPLVEQYGGEYLARGGAMDIKESALWTPTRFVLIRFPDSETANRFYHSPEYQAVLPIGLESSRRTIFVLEGM